MRVLGIETSCDETAAAVVGVGGVLSDVVHTQAEHAAWGGVVPEVAARAHAERLAGVVEEALVVSPDVDAVAVTCGPGLVGALLVGVAFARAFAAARGIPVAGVHHVEAHALAAQLMDPAPAMPFLSLVVSGGHTALYRVEGTDRIEPIAETVDDAAGEAFDKVARLMGLPWPGGPAIDRLAASGDADAVVLPRPSAADGHWSFAGLKTAARRAVERGSRPEDLAASFQRAVVDVLLARVQRAVVESRVPRVALGGGVAANSALRQRAVAELAADVFVPPRSLCTDNAAMVAHAGRMALLRGRTGRPIQARPALAIGAP